MRKLKSPGLNPEGDCFASLAMGDAFLGGFAHKKHPAAGLIPTAGRHELLMAA
jgi:hypothetical protein